MSKDISVANLSCNPKWAKIVAGVLCGIALLLIPPAVMGDEKPLTPDGLTGANKIHITSDRLESMPNQNVAEFIGNVRVTQGKTIITSDRLKIYYRESLASKKGAKGGEDTIKKIIARGHVIIKIDGRIAVADQAVYQPSSGVVILTGKNSKISQGASFVAGEKITYYRKSGRITVQRSGNKRVEAVFFSEGQNPVLPVNGSKKKKK